MKDTTHKSLARHVEARLVPKPVRRGTTGHRQCRQLPVIQLIKGGPCIRWER